MKQMYHNVICKAAHVLIVINYYVEAICQHYSQIKVSALLNLQYTAYCALWEYCVALRNFNLTKKGAI